MKHHPLVSNFYILLALIKVAINLLFLNLDVSAKAMDSKLSKLMALWQILETKLMLFGIP